MQTIALFGTSADPPTAGHQAIIHWLSGRFDRVAAWVSDNPFKTHQASIEQRCRMLRLLIAELDRPNISLEQDLSHPRTVIAVQRARQRWGPDAALTLTIGADLVPQLPKWYRAEELLQQVSLMVVPRPDCPLQDADLNALREMGTEVAIANIASPPVSSTAYRERGNREVLTPKIQDYIHQEQLYPCHTLAAR